MATEAERRIWAVARDNHGVVHLVHALAAGLTQDQVDHRVRTGELVRLHEAVFAPVAVHLTWRGALLAACWAGGFRAHASHRSAAQLHGLPGGSTELCEITCPRWNRAQHDGLLVHETQALDPIDLCFVEGIPCSTVARTLLDLAAVVGERLLEMALENALRRELVTLAEVHSVVRRLGGSGRRGVRKLRRLLHARSDGRRPTESEMETLMIQALRRSGLPEPVPQFEVRAGRKLIGRVDAAYPAARIAIEYDSDAFHTGRVATARDRARRQALIAASWLPIDAGSGDLRDGGPLFCAAIRRALEDRAPLRSGVAQP